MSNGVAWLAGVSALKTVHDHSFSAGSFLCAVTARAHSVSRLCSRPRALPTSALLPPAPLWCVLATCSRYRHVVCAHVAAAPCDCIMSCPYVAAVTAEQAHGHPLSQHMATCPVDPRMALPLPSTNLVITRTAPRQCRVAFHLMLGLFLCHDAIHCLTVEKSFIPSQHVFSVVSSSPVARGTPPLRLDSCSGKLQFWGGSPAVPLRHHSLMHPPLSNWPRQ